MNIYRFNSTIDDMVIRDSASELTDSDLLAALLRIDQATAYSLLQRYGGSLRKLMNCTPEELKTTGGIGPAKVVQLRAAAQLARRYMAERSDRGEALTNPGSTRCFLRAALRDEPYEVFCTLFLNTRHRVISFEPLFRGTIDASHVHPRVVVERALANRSAAVIVAHNHPSGVAEPSQADLAITRCLRDSLALVDIRLLDHFIVGDAEVVSLAERGLV